MPHNPAPEHNPADDVQITKEPVNTYDAERRRKAVEYVPPLQYGGCDAARYGGMSIRPEFDGNVWDVVHELAKHHAVLVEATKEEWQAGEIARLTAELTAALSRAEAAESASDLARNECSRAMEGVNRQIKVIQKQRAKLAAADGLADAVRAERATCQKLKGPLLVGNVSMSEQIGKCEKAVDAAIATYDASKGTP